MRKQAWFICSFEEDVVFSRSSLHCVPCPLLSSAAPDGKLFDAFVSYLHGDAMCSSRAMTFALHMLPEVLERQHGYTLYVRGRDDTPGEGAHTRIHTHKHLE